MTRGKNIFTKIFFYAYYLAQRVINHLVLDKILLRKNIPKIKGLCKPRKVLIVIMHCENAKYRLDYLTDYYSQFNFADYIFYADYEDLLRKVLKVSYSKEYESNELKHINILNLIIQSQIYREYEGVFLIDDDTFVNMKLLNIEIDRLSNNSLTAYGEILDVINNRSNPVFKTKKAFRYLSGGAGYILSSDIFNHISQFKMKFTDYADYTLGLNFRNYPNIKLCSDKGFHSQKHTFYDIDDDEIKNNLTFHYIKTEKEFKWYADNI